MSGWNWMGRLSYTAVTPRASLQSDANNKHVLRGQTDVQMFPDIFASLNSQAGDPSPILKRWEPGSTDGVAERNRLR